MNRFNLKKSFRVLRRGFTFTEVMFAVILLGIGFIMLAGMFPVAIQQTQTTMEESISSTLVQAATRYMEQSLTSADVNPTNGTFMRLTQRADINSGLPLSDITLWQKLRGGFILSQDPRYAWTAIYRRNRGDNFAQVIIFACQARNYANYVSFAAAPGWSDLDQPPTPTNPSMNLGVLEPRYLYAVLSDGGQPGEPDIIEFAPPPPSEPDFRDLLVEGCFVVVAADRVPNDIPQTSVFDPGNANGRIYRVGSRRADLDGVNIQQSFAWELMPGHDMQSPEENLPLRKSNHGTMVSPPDYTDHVMKPTIADAAVVFIVGKGYTDPHPSPPQPPDLSFSGFAQDIAVYSTFVRLK